MGEDNFIDASTINVHYYFDGGSIGIECFGRYNGEWISNKGKYGNLITIDNSLQTGFNEGSEERGKWYLGWKHKGGLLIDDLDFKEEVIDSIKAKIEDTNSLLYSKIIPSLFNDKGNYRDKKNKKDEKN
jgi:hypothetical protein